jgi:beta-N-acetylhexosaminidase
VQAQSNIGGDLDWPKVPVIDEQPQQNQQSPQRRRPSGAGQQGASQSESGAGGQGQAAGSANQGNDGDGAARTNKPPQSGATASTERERPGSPRRQPPEAAEDNLAERVIIPPIPARAVRPASVVRETAPARAQEVAKSAPAAPAAPVTTEKADTTNDAPAAPAEPKETVAAKEMPASAKEAEASKQEWAPEEPLPAPVVPKELAAAPKDVVAAISPVAAPSVSGAASEEKASAPAEPAASKEEPVAAEQPPAAPEPVRETASKEPPVAPAEPKTLAMPAAGAATPVLLAPPPEQNPRLGKVIGQMIMVGFGGVWLDETGSIAAQIKSGRIGGVLFTPRNIQSPTQVRGLTSAFRNLNAETLPLLAVAQEGGSVHTLSPEKGFQPYPPASELGMGNDPLKAYALYQRMATELSYYGFNVNMGPVLDLYHGDPKNISDAGGRSYGSQPKHVAAFAKAFRLAHAEQNVLTVLKHFPCDLPDQAGSGGGGQRGWEPADTEPYRDLITGGNADMIMAGHFAHPDISAEPGLPASLSPKAIQKLLREDIGYQGVVVSDDLEAPEVASKFPLEDRVVRAIVAGTDILLFGDRAPTPSDLPDRISGIIRSALASGKLTRDRLEESYSRITALKQRLSGAGKAAIAAAAKDEGDRTAGSSR